LSSIDETDSTNTSTSEFDSATESATTSTNGVMEKTGEIIEVVFVDSGFVPDIVEINVGDTVRFVNNSSTNMWIASDEHPTHMLLPTLDQLEEVGANGVYEYTFTKIGTWTYHNDVDTSLTGVVIVK